MMAKLFKPVIVFAMTLTLFAGTAMADRWGRDCRQPQKWNHHQPKHHYEARYHHDHRGPVYVAPPAPHYRQPQYHASSVHPLAPRIVIVGGLPFPVPPPPHVVLDYLTGH